MKHQIKSLEQYHSDYKLSIENPEIFWADIAETFVWKKKWLLILKNQNLQKRTAWMKYFQFMNLPTRVKNRRFRKNIKK